MKIRKKNHAYYFSVEGETEELYLKWLQQEINSSEKAIETVSFAIQVEKSPLKALKKFNITKKTEIWHLSDYESSESIHDKAFKATMDSMKKAEKAKNSITYKFGYSNLTFDLWIALHKLNCYDSVAHRKNYLKKINKAFDEKFESMDEYKEKANFNRCLNKLTLSDVIEAIKRAETIEKNNKSNGCKLSEYNGYKYYNENPSLDIWKPIKTILENCNLMPNK